MNINTPMMKQWKSLKVKAKDALLLFRLGDFYEAFLEDAILISKELNLTLTKRQEIPMCGVPFHTFETYLDKLISKGYKVAIAEQMEDAKNVKGIVKRDITQILSPATITNSNFLDEKTNNYFVSIKNWKGLKSIVMIESTREKKGIKSTENRFYISSLEADPKKMLSTIRSHWGIENGLHWILDMSFGEDQNRIRKGNAPENMAVMRHCALNMLQKYKGKRQSIKGLRKLAGWKDEVLKGILNVNLKF